MTSDDPLKKQILEIAQHFREREAQILDALKRRAERDRHMTTASAISSVEFMDHLPQVLSAFESHLLAQSPQSKIQALEEEKARAWEHGFQRWHLGYDEGEVLREWGHLQLCLLDELHAYTDAHPGLDAGVLRVACRAIARLCSEGTVQSATRYSELQRQEAASRARELATALRELETVEQRRAEAWREAAHDLRGNLGVVKQAADLLSLEEVQGEKSGRSLQLLHRGVNSLQTLLESLLSLARLEAGQERRTIETVEVGRVLEELCEPLEEVARSRGLTLRRLGSPTLQVQCDEVRLRRIAQNLVLNAIMHTQGGVVQVSWDLIKSGSPEEPQRWVLTIRDSGPGIQPEKAGPVGRALMIATETLEGTAKPLHHKVAGISGPEAPADRESNLQARPDASEPGEGIGLAIVKRLCDLLDATIQIESRPGVGTEVRVLFPVAYDPS